MGAGPGNRAKNHRFRRDGGPNRYAWEKTFPVSKKLLCAQVTLLHIRTSGNVGRLEAPCRVKERRCRERARPFGTVQVVPSTRCAVQPQ